MAKLHATFPADTGENDGLTLYKIHRTDNDNTEDVESRL